jgi:hypothetical protein
MFFPFGIGFGVGHFPLRLLQRTFGLSYTLVSLYLRFGRRVAGALSAMLLLGRQRIAPPKTLDT